MIVSGSDGEEMGSNRSSAKSKGRSPEEVPSEERIWVAVRMAGEGEDEEDGRTVALLIRRPADREEVSSRC